MRVGVVTPCCRGPLWVRSLPSGSRSTSRLWNLAPAMLAMHTARSMLEEAIVLAEFQRVIADHGATIAALSCHGNALRPDRARAEQDREVSRETIVLAERPGIPVFYCSLTRMWYQWVTDRFPLNSYLSRGRLGASRAPVHARG